MIVGRTFDLLVALVIALILVPPFAASIDRPEFIVLLELVVGWAAIRSYRHAARTLVFDARARALRISDRGWRRRERSIAFAAIRSLTIEQRQPRRIANAPRVLVIDGEELLSVQDTYANARLEEELQGLVGLPLRASPRDTEGIAGP